MAYPPASDDHIRSFAEHGFLTVRDAVAPGDLDALADHCQTVIDNKEEMAWDWAWEEGRSPQEREFRFLQASLSRHWPEVRDAPFVTWAAGFATALMGRPVEFWYDQFLAKPPERGAVTRWHQDEGYWGRNLDDSGITCWMPLHDVDTTNGCMHFVRGGHRDGVLPHRRPENIKADSLCCDVDESRAVAAPLAKGDVTFHHSKTPHMASANTSDAWRRALTMHFKAEDVTGEGDHYPWRALVDQRTGQRYDANTLQPIDEA